MKLSNIIKEVQYEIDHYGDLEVLRYSFCDEQSESTCHRLNKDGTKMNLKQFKQYLNTRNLTSRSKESDKEEV
jgi:hypothetical protein